MFHGRTAARSLRAAYSRRAIISLCSCGLTSDGGKLDNAISLVLHDAETYGQRNIPNQYSAADAAKRTLYTGDEDYLVSHALPFMYETALFYEDFAGRERRTAISTCIRRSRPRTRRRTSIG